MESVVNMGVPSETTLFLAEGEHAKKAMSKRNIA